MTVSDVAARLRQPEYTGDNRCLPCTVVNLLVASVLAVAVGLATTPLVGSLVLGASAALIYLRGYLLPGTPTLTRRYFPPWLLRAFGKSPVSDEYAVWSPEETTGDDLLFEAGVLTREDGVAVTDEFHAAWTGRMEDVLERGVDPGDVAAMYDAESVTRHGDESFVVDGTKSVRWGSRAALVADLAADELFRERLPAWSGLDTDRREATLRGLRLCLETCPTCDGPLAVKETRIDPCCEKPHLGAQSVCESCGAAVADAAVVDSSETTSVRAELLHS